MGSARGDMSYTLDMLNNNPLKSTSGFAITAFLLFGIAYSSKSTFSLEFFADRRDNFYLEM